MFLAHFSGWGYKEIMEMPTREISIWYNEAVKMHNYMNTAPDK